VDGAVRGSYSGGVGTAATVEHADPATRAHLVEAQANLDTRCRHRHCGDQCREHAKVESGSNVTCDDHPHLSAGGRGDLNGFSEFFDDRGDPDNNGRTRFHHCSDDCGDNDCKRCGNQAASSAPDRCAYRRRARTNNNRLDRAGRAGVLPELRRGEGRRSRTAAPQ
jgi:hypothetical protein